MPFTKRLYFKVPVLVPSILIMLNSYCIAAKISNTHYKIQTDSLPVHILIINSFDAQSIHARKNKKALFSELADSLKYMLKMEFERKQNMEIIVVPEFINNPSGNDTVYIELINKYSATQAVVIKNLNVYFEQTGVEVTKESDGKKRVASYDINADVTYLLYNNAGMMRKTETKVFEFFTERSVASGLLAGGPDIVGKSKHAFKIVQKNAEQYLREIKFDLEDE